MSRLILIDGHAILYRAYHALPPFTTTDGKPVNAVYGFTSIILKVIKDLKPLYMAVTFDRPKPTFRKKLYKDYQAKRPEMDKELVSQIELVHEVVREMKLSIFEVDGYEADDVIGTLVSKVRQNREKKNNLKDQDIETIVVTGDRDILQLVDDMTKVYMPVKGLSKSMLYGIEEVRSKFGVESSQIVDYKALVGDSSDNYPGVSGVGPKSAAMLLGQFGTLENIYNHLKEIENDNLREKLIQNKDLALLSKKLATIINDVPIRVEIANLKIGTMLNPNLVSLFERLNFQSLILRLGGEVVKKK